MPCICYHIAKAMHGHSWTETAMHELSLGETFVHVEYEIKKSKGSELR